MFITRDTTFVSSTTKIKLIAKDPESGVAKIEYSVDNEPAKVYTEPYTIDKDGLHKISFSGTDNVNNFSQNQFVVITDNKGPEIYERYSIVPISKKIINNNSIDVYPGNVILFLSATDDYVGIEKIIYSINNQPEVLYNGLIQGFTTGKEYSVKVKAIDKLGNKSIKVFEFSTAL